MSSVSTNYTIGTPFVLPAADGDPIEPTTEVYAFWDAMDKHDHTPGRGKAIAPAALSGDVLKKVLYFASSMEVG